MGSTDDAQPRMRSEWRKEQQQLPVVPERLVTTKPNTKAESGILAQSTAQNTPEVHSPPSKQSSHSFSHKSQTRPSVNSARPQVTDSSFSHPEELTGDIGGVDSSTTDRKPEADNRPPVQRKEDVQQSIDQGIVVTPLQPAFFPRSISNIATEIVPPTPRKRESLMPTNNSDNSRHELPITAETVGRRPDVCYDRLFHVEIQIKFSIVKSAISGVIK